MALSALGSKISAALGSLMHTETVDDETIGAALKDIGNALMEADVNIKLVMQLRKNVLARISSDAGPAVFDKAKLVEKCVVQELVSMLDPQRPAFKPKKGKSNVIMFVGLQGAGKTTTVAKYAHYYQSRKWKVAMVCADTFRAGAFDQLKQNATRVRVPFYGSYTETDPVKIAAEGVEQFRKERYEIIIVDTSGRHKQETALFAEMVQVQEAVRPDDIVFTMDSTIGQAAFGQAEAFKKTVPVGSVIITKLDGNSRGGGALSAVAATKSPIIFVGSGEHFDDLQPFDAEGFVSKLLGRGDMRGLMKELREKDVFDDSDKMIADIQKQGFTFRTLNTQFESLLKLGPISKVLEMMPGMSQLVAAGGGGANATAKFKKMMVIMKSMTPKELDCKVVIDQSRLMRIARGSGAHPNEVAELLAQHKQFEKMFQGMDKAGLLEGDDKTLAKKMQKNPGQMQSILGSVMDPALIKQMGGASGMMDMIKQMGAGFGPGSGGGGKKGAAGAGALGNPAMMEKAMKMMKSMGMG